jgi:hypothetical protein
MTRPILFALMILAAPAAAQQNPNWTPPPAKDGYEYPPCYCTNRGEKVEMGGEACLRIGSRRIWARCAMSVNNPIWRPIREGCPPGGPTSSLAAPATSG